MAVTEQCITNCDYCFYYKNVDVAVQKINAGRGTPLSGAKRTLSLETINRVLNQATNLGLKAIQISGGEPMLRKGLVVDIIKKAKSLGLETVLFTNGILTDDTTITELAEAGLSKTRISLGGYSYETHALQRHDPRGLKDWESITHSIVRFNNAGVKVGTLTPITKLSLPNLKQIGRFASVLGVTFITYHMYIPSGMPKQDEPNILTTEEHYSAIEDILELKKEIEGTLKVEVIPDYGIFEYLSSNWNKEMKVHPAKCGENRLGIFANGDISSCTCTSEKMENINGLDFDLADFWINNPKMIAIRQQRSNSYEPCTSCIHQDYCRPCRSYTFNLGKDNVAPQTCPAVRDYEKLILEGVGKETVLQKVLRHNLKSK